jgi:tetratricopeptide (TPR) repeat protein
MSEEPGRVFFVSYTGADVAWAEWLAWQLEAASHRAILQAWDFRPGENFVVGMRRALDTAERTLAVVSMAYLGSVYGSDEWTAAFIHERPDQTSLLVVRIEDVPLPPLLRPWVHVDLVGVDAETAVKRLLDGVTKGRRKPDQEPPFPGNLRPSTKPEAPRFPGRLPEIVNLPQRNLNFSGRSELVEGLRANGLERSSATVTQIQAVHGLGGVGKTSLALEFAHRYASDYDLIWWVGAERSAAIARGLVALARRLGIQGRANQGETIQALWEQLRGRNRWLLIFDDVEDPKDLESYRPPIGGGRVLITSRHRAWGQMARPVLLDVLPREESVGFLSRRTGEQDVAAADAIAAELGDLPLALEEAAAFIEETGVSLEQYLQLVRERMAELLELGEPPDDEQRVATVWSVSLERVHDEAPAAEALLKLCAFLGSDDIPRDLLSEHATQLPQPLAGTAADVLAYKRLVGAAARYSLLTVTPNRLGMHRLLQAVVRSHIGGEQERTWAQLAVELLVASFPDQPREVASWPACQELLPHALQVAEHAKRLHVNQEATGRLLDRSAIYLHARGQYQQARPIADQAATLTESSAGPEHPDLADRLDTLGRVLRELGDYSEARALFERALTIHQTTSGVDSESVAVMRNELGRVLRDLGDLLGARSQFEQALTIGEQALGPTHPDVATRRDNLGRVLQDLGDLSGARSQFEQALTISEQALGPTHPDVATRRDNLGRVLQDLGDLSGARSQLEQALTISEQALGPTHPTVATYRNNLGLVLQDLGDLSGARSQLEQALTISEQALGPTHPDIAIRRNNLGRVLEDLGDLSGARSQLEQALTIGERTLGPIHPRVATRRKNLGLVLERLGDLPAARSQLEQALTIGEQTLGPTHPTVVTYRRHLESLVATPEQ